MVDFSRCLYVLNATHFHIIELSNLHIDQSFHKKGKRMTASKTTNPSEATSINTFVNGTVVEVLKTVKETFINNKS